jgi:hypothetical protein
LILYSPYIESIAGFLSCCGVTVHRHAHVLPCAGMYRSETREIFLNESNALEALLTLAHEAGHWLGYLLDPRQHSYQRERQAYVYGWHVLRWFDVPVTRERWISDCRTNERLRLVMSVETTHLYRATVAVSATGISL